MYHMGLLIVSDDNYGYTWTNAIYYNDNNFTYNDTAGTFSYDGKLCDVFRGAKAIRLTVDVNSNVKT